MRESHLDRAVDECGEVVRVEPLTGGLVELSARLPALAAAALPGEFAQLLCGPGPVPLLRRPFSVAWTEGDLVSFVFEPTGVGTRLLAAKRPGDALQSLGPLGLGFDLSGVDRVVCVAGGLGAAPFPLLVRVARRAGREVVVVNGAASEARLYPAHRLSRGDEKVHVREATDDGSRGHHGYVTDLVNAEITPTTLVAGCGPNPMLASLARELERGPVRPLRAEVSLEAPMGCGFGTCLGCAVPVHVPEGEAQWALCCRQGPVMPVEMVDWRALAELPGADVA